MPLTLHTSPPSPTRTVSIPLSNTMNIIPNSRLAVSTSSATRNDDTAQGTRECHSKVPVVKLDVDTISDMMASSLASSLLAHVLFLKNQIPLYFRVIPVLSITNGIPLRPVIQLAKLSNTKRNNNVTNTRATKHRTELLATYDTLASHLSTTFTSLSTAFARSKRLDASSQSSCQPTAFWEQDNTDEGNGANISRRKTIRAYIAILVGPSIGSARSKVLLGVDGLEARIWGEREDVLARDADESEEEEEADESEDDESEEEDGEESEDNEENAEQEEGEEDKTGEEDEQEPLELSDEDGNEATPPPSSPSLSSSSLSSSSSSLPHISPKLLPTSIPPLKSPPAHSQPQISPTKATPPPYISHAQQQQTLLNAERLLSRTLALADADGYSLASDMTPTQTHILIRAPRRFSHPAWIPRQNVTASMEKALEEFLQESGITSSCTLPADRSCQNKGNSRKDGRKNMKKVEGVWVVGRKSRIGKDDTDDTNREAREEDERKEPDDEMNENDDIIWWSWDGKLVGFSDW